MPKLKSIKALSKRFRITRKGKVVKRTAGQDHFNRKEPGKVTRQKRLDLNLADSHAKVMKKLIK